MAAPCKCHVPDHRSLLRDWFGTCAYGQSELEALWRSQQGSQTMNAPAHNITPLLQPKQVLQLINISRSTLTKLQQSGRLKPVRLLGNVVRFRRADVEALIDGTAPEARSMTNKGAQAKPVTGRPRGRPRKHPLPLISQDDEV